MSAVVVEMVQGFPFHRRLVALVHFAAPSYRRREQVEFALDAVTFGVCVGLELLLRQRSRIVPSVSLVAEQSYLLMPVAFWFPFAFVYRPLLEIQFQLNSCNP